MKNYNLCQHWTRLTQNLSIIVLSSNVSNHICHFSIGGVCFLEKSDTKKSILFSILFSSLLCMRKPSFLKDSSLLCTYSSSCPLPHKNITFCIFKTKKVGPVLTKNEWDSFKSGNALRLTSFLVFSVDTASTPSSTCSLPLFSLFTYLDLLFERQGHILGQSPILL